MIHALIVPAEIRDDANLFAHQLGIDPEGLMTTLSAPLVPILGPDDAEPTHYGCCGFITPEQRATIKANQSSFPGAFGWAWSDDGILLDSFDDLNLGEQWDWSRSLVASSLKLWVGANPASSSPPS